MWKAVFEDGTTLEEYNKFGQEILFAEVMKRVDSLVTLTIILSSTKTFTVRLKDGRFTTMVDGVENHFYGFDVTQYDVSAFTNIRPIYFVRETVDFHINQGPAGAVHGSAPRVNFVALGFQANYQGKSFKRYLAIYPDGKYWIKDA